MGINMPWNFNPKYTNMPLSKTGCQMLTRPLLLYGWSTLPRHLNSLPIYPAMPPQITSLVASSPGHPTCRPKWLDLRIALPLPMVSIKIITSCLTNARETQPLCKITNTKQNCTNNALKFQNCGRVGEINFNILHHVVVSAEMFPPKKL